MILFCLHFNKTDSILFCRHCCDSSSDPAHCTFSAESICWTLDRHPDLSTDMVCCCLCSLCAGFDKRHGFRCTAIRLELQFKVFGYLRSRTTSGACLGCCTMARQLNVAVCGTTSVLEQSAFDAAQRTNRRVNAQSPPADTKSCALTALHTPCTSLDASFALVDAPASGFSCVGRVISERYCITPGKVGN